MVWHMKKNHRVEYADDYISQEYVRLLWPQILNTDTVSIPDFDRGYFLAENFQFEKHIVNSDGRFLVNRISDTTQAPTGDMIIMDKTTVLSHITPEYELVNYDNPQFKVYIRKHAY